MEVREQLRALAIAHYVVGTLHAMMGCIGLLHVALGLSILVEPSLIEKSQAPPFVAWIFLVIGAGFVTAGVTLGVLTILSGRFIARRSHRTFSIVMAAINCTLLPIGTVLGIFDLVILTRTDVIASYGTGGITAP